VKLHGFSASIYSDVCYLSLPTYLFCLYVLLSATLCLFVCASAPAILFVRLYLCPHLFVCLYVLLFPLNSLKLELSKAKLVASKGKQRIKGPEILVIYIIVYIVCFANRKSIFTIFIFFTRRGGLEVG
jgi:hypothetical protein